MSIHPDARAQEVLETLKAQAEARNISLAEYLEFFAEAGDVGPAAGPLSLDEFDALLDQVAEAFPPLPSLPADFSRQDLYADHD